MTDFSANVSIGGVIAALRNVANLDRGKVFRRARPDLRKELAQHGRDQSGPNGRWQALATTTKQRRARGGRGSRRKLLGRLPRAFIIKASRDNLSAISAPRWSRGQNEGTTAGKGSRIPAREYVWIGKSMMGRVRDLFREALLFAWKKRR